MKFSAKNINNRNSMMSAIGGGVGGRTLSATRAQQYASSSVRTATSVAKYAVTTNNYNAVSNMVASLRASVQIAIINLIGRYRTFLCG